MRWMSPAGHVLRTLPERPFMPVGAGGVVSPPIAESFINDPPTPPDLPDAFEDEWRSLIELYDPVPF